MGGVKAKQRIKDMGLPGKPPGSPILYDLVDNRIGSRLKAGVTNGGVGNIAYKDSQQDFTKNSRKNITQDLDDCLKGERKRGTASLFRGPSPWAKMPAKYAAIPAHPYPRWLSPPSP